VQVTVKNRAALNCLTIRNQRRPPRAIPRYALRMRSCISRRFPCVMMRRAAQSEKSQIGEPMVSSAD
jgi:hypothetical protein